MKRSQILLDELLEKVEETRNSIINEVEREEHLMEYLEALSYVESVIIYFKENNQEER